MQNSIELFRSHICRGRQLDRMAAFLQPTSFALEGGEGAQRSFFSTNSLVLKDLAVPNNSYSFSVDAHAIIIFFESTVAGLKTIIVVY